MRRFRLMWAGVVALLVADGCASAKTEYLPPSSPTVIVAMREFQFDYDKAIPSGRVVLRFDNRGKLAHKVQILPLDDDFPSIEEQIRGDQRRFVPPYAQIFPKAPGESGSVALSLSPGHRYAFICQMFESDGESHAFKGMASEFRAGPAERGKA